MSCFSLTIQANSGQYLELGHDRFLSRPFLLIYYSLPFSHSHTLISTPECFRITRIVCRDMIIIRGPRERDGRVRMSGGAYGVLKYSKHCIELCDNTNETLELRITRPRLNLRTSLVSDVTD
jgi:hypothetical protein